MLRIVLVIGIVVLGALFALFTFGNVALPSFGPQTSAADVTDDLFAAAEAGDRDAVAEALALEAPADARDPFGRTALMIAAAAGRDGVATDLLEAGADVHAQDDQGRTPLMHAAASAPSATTALLLLNAASDPHLTDEDGNRALEHAAANAPVRSSGLFARLQELTEFPESLRALRGGEAFSRDWPAGYLVPIEDANLSSRASHLPGAPRAYRNGTHEGFDFYDGTVSVEIAYGTPQRAAANGVVIRADVDYADMTEAEYEDVIRTARESLSTPPEILDALRGRQVWIRHPGGFVTRYAHLSGVAEGVVEGIPVQQGATIGFTGNSGTIEAATGTQDDPHPHLEIWRGDETYLGQGLEPAEIYALAAQVFGTSALPPFTDSGLDFR
ncbi:MAG: ankyrin repeat domain-containing protein [Trueperaceae bacterium]